MQTEPCSPLWRDSGHGTALVFVLCRHGPKHFVSCQKTVPWPTLKWHGLSPSSAWSQRGEGRLRVLHDLASEKDGGARILPLDLGVGRNNGDVARDGVRRNRGMHATRERRSVCGGRGAARADAHRVRWNGSRSEGRGLEDEWSGFFERDGSWFYAGLSCVRTRVTRRTPVEIHYWICRPIFLRQFHTIPLENGFS
jgi:hypothetical protein